AFIRQSARPVVRVAGARGLRVSDQEDQAGHVSPSAAICTFGWVTNRRARLYLYIEIAEGCVERSFFVGALSTLANNQGAGHRIGARRISLGACPGNDHAARGDAALVNLFLRTSDIHD